MRLPGTLPSGRVIDELTGSLDLAPTMLELTGVPIAGELSERLDGRSLVDLMIEPTAPADWPQEVYSEFGREFPVRHRMVKTHTDKYSFDEKNSGVICTLRGRTRF